jgi:transposase
MGRQRPDLANGTVRKKIPALRKAPQGRSSGHHALLVGQMLAQIDFLDDDRDAVGADRGADPPFSRQLELVDPIPGVDKRVAEMLLARSDLT